MPKSNIDSVVTRNSSWVNQRYRDGAPYGAPSTQAVVDGFEVRKLVRDVVDPTSRREKPYHTKRSICSYPRGGIAWAYSGRVYETGSGGFGTTAFSGGVRASMRYPQNGTAKYTPTTGDWPLNPDLLSQAEVKCYAALRNKLSEMDLKSYLNFGLWYGERAETASLLRDVAEGLKRLITAYRSRNAQGLVDSITHFRVSRKNSELWQWAKQEIKQAHKSKKPLTRAKDVLRFANKAVLQWNLGVSPLVSDMNKAYMACHAGSVDLEALVIKAKGWEERQFIDTQKLSAYAGRLEWAVNVNSLVRHTCVLNARPVDSALAFLERAGLANAPSLLFELTPLSFLLNYFWSIGDYLKAVSTPMAFQFIDGSYSVKVSHLQNMWIKSHSPDRERRAEGAWTHVEYRRKLYGAFPFPIPPLSLRASDLNARQATNTAAITLSWVRKALGW